MMRYLKSRYFRFGQGHISWLKAFKAGVCYGTRKGARQGLVQPMRQDVPSDECRPMRRESYSLICVIPQIAHGNSRRVAKDQLCFATI